MTTTTKGIGKKKIILNGNGVVTKSYTDMSKEELIEEIHELKNRIIDFEQINHKREERKNKCIVELTGLLHTNGVLVYGNGVVV